MTRCGDRQAKQALKALFQGELDGEGFTRLRAHTAGCGECREAYDRLGRVESALEKRALPASREALLEKELLARLGATEKPARAPVPERKRFFPQLFVPAMAGLAMAGVALLLVVPRLREPKPEWQARGGDTGTAAWGIRVFCVGADGQVRGEARPGGRLVCGEGSAVQFSYTAPEAARLTVEATSPEGEPLRFFPREGAVEQVAAGVDVLLPFSTPVQEGWLAGPLEVRARFEDARGRELSRTHLILSPRYHPSVKHPSVKHASVTPLSRRERDGVRVSSPRVVPCEEEGRPIEQSKRPDPLARVGIPPTVRWAMSAYPAVRVLFLSMGNAARSIMAECLLRRLGHERFAAFSAGVLPRGEVHPLALKVLRERFRLEPEGARSKSWVEFRGEHFELVITLCDKAREDWAVWPGQPRMAHWDEPDPVAFEGSEAARERLFLQVGRELSVRLELVCALPLEKLMRLSRGDEHVAAPL